MQGRSPAASAQGGLPRARPEPAQMDFSVLRALFAERRDDAEWSSRLAAQLTEAAFTALPEFTSDELLREASARATLRVVHLVIESVLEGADPHRASAPAEMVEAARELMRRGEPVERLIRAYHIAHARFFELWAREVRASVRDSTLMGAALEQGAVWTFAFVDAIGRDIAALHSAERERWASGAAAVRLREVHAVLSGAQSDASLASARLGYELALNHRALVVWDDSGYDDARLPRLETAAATLTERLEAPSCLVIALSEDTVAAWTSIPRGAADGGLPAALAGLDVSVAVGSVHAGLAGFRRSHEEALAARRVARLRGEEPAQVAYGDVALLDLASRDLDSARNFVESELGALAAEDPHTVRLAETLRVYLEALGSPRRAAAILDVHENTVTNRVHAAAALLEHGVDERVPELLLALRIAPVVRGALGRPALRERTVKVQWGR